MLVFYENVYKNLNHKGFDITAWVLMKKEYKMNTHFDPSRVYDVPIFAWFIL